MSGITVIEPTDSDLVRQAKAGQLQAMELLVTRHERKVYSLAYRMLQNQHDAEDITQQAFLSAIENLADFREESSFGTWIMRIATHAALKVIRKRKRWEPLSMDTPQPEDGDSDGIKRPEYIADWREAPDALAQRTETFQMIESALAQLDEKYRLIFLLRDVEGFSVEETAEMLSISAANVKVRLLRARLELRETLTQILGDPHRKFAPHQHEQNEKADQAVKGKNL